MDDLVLRTLAEMQDQMKHVDIVQLVLDHLLEDKICQIGLLALGNVARELTIHGYGPLEVAIVRSIVLNALLATA